MYPISSMSWTRIEKVTKLFKKSLAHVDTFRRWKQKHSLPRSQHFSHTDPFSMSVRHWQKVCCHPLYNIVLSFYKRNSTRHKYTFTEAHTRACHYKMALQTRGAAAGALIFHYAAFPFFFRYIVHSTNGLSLIRTLRFHPEKYSTLTSTTLIVTLTS